MAQTKGQDPAFNKLYADFARKKVHDRDLRRITCRFFLQCKKLLVPGITFHLRLFRSPGNTLLLLKDNEWRCWSESFRWQNASSHWGSFSCMRKVVMDTVNLSFEKALSKSCAFYPFIESLIKRFIIQAGENCFVRENFFCIRADPQIKFVWSKTPSCAVHPWTIYQKIFTKNSVFRGLQFNAVIECH